MRRDGGARPGPGAQATLIAARLPDPSGCHAPPAARIDGDALRIALVGAPNVGKSALFNRLTARYTTVSNFPGTSVEVARGAARLGGVVAEVIDTPGLYSLLPTTEEERVAQQIVLDGAADVIVHVADAKNLERTLPLTLQLAEVGRPLVLALNMSDEADRAGVRIDYRLLGARLGIAVVPVVAITGRGIADLEGAILAARDAAPPLLPAYRNGVGHAIQSVHERLAAVYPIDPRALVALALQGDASALEEICRREARPELAPAVQGAASRLEGPAPYRVAWERQRTADALLDGAFTVEARPDATVRDRLGRLLANPWTGLPVLALVLYVGLYKFVGQLGAGTLVDLIESRLFEGWLNPLAERLFAAVPWPVVSTLFVGDYGVITLGVRYAVAIILPVVGTFFLFFSVLEDTGYFPRLALLVDRGFKRIGLSGRAVIPMVLGFACDTMATMVTRTLETKRERVLATLLLALAIPCSAQLGVILAILSGEPAALAVWVVVLFGTFAFVGALGARVLKGETASFHMELPPLRMPRLSNVLVKTMTRMQWYFVEVLPLFLLASVLLWAGSWTGALDAVIAGIAPAVRLLGLPADAAPIFLLGFFRRDYGAAGLYDLHGDGLLSVGQLTVAAVTLTLFVPCIAQFLMMLRERGWKTALGMLLFITPFAFGVGATLNLVLRSFGW